MKENKNMSLSEALPKEIERVQEIIHIYNSLPNLDVWGNSYNMRAGIAKAHKAMIEGNIVEMVRVYEELKEWKL